MDDIVRTAWSWRRPRRRAEAQTSSRRRPSSRPAWAAPNSVFHPAGPSAGL